MEITKIIITVWLILDLIALSLIYLRPDKSLIQKDFYRWFNRLSLYSLIMSLVLIIILPFSIIPSIINIKNK